MGFRTIRRFWGIAGLMSLCMACGNAQTVKAERPNSPGWHENSLEQPQLTRSFRYYVPQDLPANAPVVILFHGGTQSMSKIFQENAGGSQAWQPLAAKAIGKIGMTVVRRSRAVAPPPLPMMSISPVN
jgi:poly(3-hydroxybutyrate) depolymerase